MEFDHWHIVFDFTCGDHCLCTLGIFIRSDLQVPDIYLDADGCIYLHKFGLLILQEGARTRPVIHVSPRP